MRAASTKQAEQLRMNVSKAAREDEERSTRFGKEAVRMKATIANGIDDRVKVARRAVKRGYRATVDFVEDATYRIKRDPLRALSLSFVAGVAAGWLIPHRTRGRRIPALSKN